MMAVLLMITIGGVYVGSAVIARNRAQAAADLVEGLDVDVTVEARVSLGRIAVGPARAAARAGPVEAGG